MPGLWDAPADSGRRVTAPFVSSSTRFEVTTPPPSDGSSRARTGLLTLPHGTVETPQFMPVGTNATVKALSPDDFAMRARRSSCRTPPPVHLRPDHERIARLGGLHQFMDWDRPILTDSGGFQVVSLGDLRVVDDDGVTFRSHLDGSIHRFTPEHATAVQEALGSGGGLRPAGLPELAAAGRGRCDGANASLGGALAGRSFPHRPGAIRHRAGWPRSGLPRRSAQFVASLPFDGIVGGLAGDEVTGRARHDARRLHPALADDPRPRYLMGLGSPADLLEAVQRGVDLFDSVCRRASLGTGKLWVPGGRLNLRNRGVPRRSGAGPGGLSVPPLPALLEGVPGSSVPRKGAARVPPRDLSQPHFTLDFMARIRASIGPARPPRRDVRTALPRGRMVAVKRRAVRVKDPSVRCMTTRRRRWASGSTAQGNRRRSRRPSSLNRVSRRSGTAAERGGDPQAAQGEASRRGRHRRGLTGRTDATGTGSADGMDRSMRSVTNGWR